MLPLGQRAVVLGLRPVQDGHARHGGLVLVVVRDAEPVRGRRHGGEHVLAPRLALLLVELDLTAPTG